MPTCQTIFDPIGEYLCTNVYDGTGSQTAFVYDFDYLNKENWAINSPNSAASDYNAYLRVYVDGTLTPYTMTNSYTLVLESAPAEGTANVVIRRDSSVRERKVDYVQGSTLTEANLDRDSKQAFFLIQEMYDRALDAQCQISNARFLNTYLFGPVDGNTFSFDLTNATSAESNLLNINELLVLLNGTAQQQRSTVYSVSLVNGICRVTLASAPAAGTLVSITALTSGVPQTVTIGDNSIDTGDIVNGAVTWAKTNHFADTGSSGQILVRGASEFAAATPVAAHISDFQTAVRTNKVTDLTAPTTSFSMNSHKIVNLLDPASAQDAATKAYVDSVADTTYGPSYKMIQVSVTQNSQTVTCPFEADYIRLTIEGETVSGSTLGSPVYSTTIPHSRTYTFSQIGSTQAWVFRRAPSSAQAASIDVHSSGSNITLKNTQFSYNYTGTNVITVEFIKNSPSV